MERVLQFVTVMDRGGQETLWMNVFREIDRSKIQFDFLVTLDKKGDYDDEIKMLGGKIHYLGNNPYCGGIKKYFGEILLLKKFFKSHPEYSTFHINTCHALPTFFSVLGARLGGVSRIIVHSHNTQAIHPMRHKFAKPILNMLRFEALACANDAGVWMFGKRKVKAGKVKIVKNGIDTARYKFDEAIRIRKRYELGVDDSTFLVGHVGRFNFQKNHSFLVDVFEQVCKKNPNCKLILVGRGELESEIKDKIKERHLMDKVIFAGIRSDVNELLMAMDVFLFPSLFEGLAVVLLEAQASGLRVVCSSNMAPEVVISRKIEQVSLQDSLDLWTTTVLNCADNDRKEINQSILDAGYDIRQIAKELEFFYLN